MAVRYVGDAKIVVVYEGQTTDGNDRAQYRVSVKDMRPGEKGLTHKGMVGSAVGGPEVVANAATKTRRKVAVDAPEAYDEIALTAVTFATSAGRETSERDQEIASAIEEATASAWGESGLVVRRSP